MRKHRLLCSAAAVNAVPTNETRQRRRPGPERRTTITAPILTTTTCNEACWFAREDECHCSCGGRNHGCLRTEGGEQPTRNRRVGNARYLLQAVGTFSDCSRTRYDIDRAWYNATTYETRRGRGEAAIVARATEDQAARWPEVYAYATATGTKRPYLLWVREDLA